jgi:hypothetical protein
LQGFNKSNPSIYLNNQKCGFDEFNPAKQYGGFDEFNPTKQYGGLDELKP